MAQVVFSAAIMDVLHKGHLNLLRTMRDRAGDGLLIMVLHDDESCFKIKDKIPIHNIEQRIRNLEITGLVDHVLVANSVDPADQFGFIYGTYKGDVEFVRGDDNKTPPGHWLLEKLNIKQTYLPYTKGISSSEVRSRL